MCVCQAFPKCDLLLDNNVQGSGFYLPELDEPEHCNAQNTALWELHTLQVRTNTHARIPAAQAFHLVTSSHMPQKHYHPVVQKMARHLGHGAPSEGQAALSVDLSRRYEDPTSCVDTGVVSAGRSVWLLPVQVANGAVQNLHC